MSEMMVENTVEKYKNVIERSAIFREIDVTKELLCRSEERKYKKGEVIFSPEIYLHGIGIILEGRAKITKKDSDGKTTLLAIREASAIFGVGTVFNGAARYPTLITALSNVKILFISEDALEEIFRKNFICAKNYMRFLSQRIVFLNRKIDAFTAESAEMRLMIFLSDMLDEDGEDIQTVKPEISYKALAQALSISRASLYRVFDSLENEGIISKDDAGIKIEVKKFFYKINTGGKNI